MLSDQQIEHLWNEYIDSQTENDSRFIKVICEAQHKADLEEFQKLKQEMLKEIELNRNKCQFDCGYYSTECNYKIMGIYCQWWQEFKQRCGVK